MRFLTTLLSIALTCFVGEVAAQPAAWPTKPLRLVLGYPAGGGADSVVRVFTAGMEKALGQPIVIDYRPGAGATLAAENAARSPADGYTIHYIDSAPLTITPHLRRLPYDPLASFTAVSLVVRGDMCWSGIRLLVSNHCAPWWSWQKQSPARSVTALPESAAPDIFQAS